MLHEYAQGKRVANLQTKKPAFVLGCGPLHIFTHKPHTPPHSDGRCGNDRSLHEQGSRLRKSRLAVAMSTSERHRSLPVISEPVELKTIRPSTVKNFSIPYDDLVIRAWQPKDRAACVEVIGAVLEEYGLEWDPTGADRDVVEVETAYESGEFWVVEDLKTLKVVGTAAFYEVPHRGTGAIEVRKMYLDKAVRGQGLGSFLLRAVEHRAQQLGYTKAVVETASVLKEATLLYESRGYVSSSGLETQRCDMILERDLTKLLPLPDEEHVEVIDMTLGWTVTFVTRKQALKHRILYRAIAVLIESDGKVFVHQRSMKKSTYPGRMAALVTGCVHWMEDPLHAAHREVREEIGISGLSIIEAFSPFVAKGRDGLRQRIKFHPYIARGSFNEEDVVCDPDEVEGGELVSRDEIMRRGIGGSLWKEYRAHGL